MIKELKKIIKSEIKKAVKKDLYRKKILTDSSKVTSISVGKISY